MRKIYAVAALLCFVHLSSLYAENNAPVVPMSSPLKMSTHELKDAKIISLSKNEKNLHLKYTFHVKYPQITGPHLTLNEKKFNHLIMDYVSEEVGEFKQSVKKNLADAKQLPLEIQHNSLYMDYDLHVLQSGGTTFVSVNMSLQRMYAGMAHPEHYIKVVNYDLSRGKKLALSDLFKPGVEFLPPIANFVQEKLKMDRKDNPYIFEDEQLKKGTESVESNYRLWNMNDEGLVFFFNPAIVAASVAREQKVEVPYAKLVGLLLPKMGSQ